MQAQPPTHRPPPGAFSPQLHLPTNGRNLLLRKFVPKSPSGVRCPDLATAAANLPHAPPRTSHSTCPLTPPALGCNAPQAGPTNQHIEPRGPAGTCCQLLDKPPADTQRNALNHKHPSRAQPTDPPQPHQQRAQAQTRNHRHSRTTRRPPPNHPVKIHRPTHDRALWFNHHEGATGRQT